MAVFSVFVAPMLQNRFGATKVLTGTLFVLMLDLIGLGLAAGHSVPAVVILVAVAFGGRRYLATHEPHLEGGAGRGPAWRRSRHERACPSR